MAQRKTVERGGKKPAAVKPQAERTIRVARTTRVAKLAPAAAVEADGKNGREAKDAKKHKLVRDSFTMPRTDFELIHTLKERALGFKRPTKKSELLRAGLQALAALDDAALKARLERLIPLKPGRPKQRP